MEGRKERRSSRISKKRKKLEGFERNSFDNRRLGYKLLSSLNLNDIRVCREERYGDSKGVSWGVVRDH